MLMKLLCCQTICGAMAERMQCKLMREREFLNPQHPTPDATEYIDLYDDDLPEQAIKALRAATPPGQQIAMEGLSSNG
jgi:hypothetical protein